MSIRVLEWLDTHLLHHRWEWHPLNAPLRFALTRLVCDRFEARLLASEEPTQ